tara:strand:- start:22156 stop:22356 length:201 start_codon:yes stop_codon:yes gene_type:complete
MSYSVRKRTEGFVVVEQSTKQDIAKFNDRDEARQLCRSLNLGGGFNGWTPRFMSIWNIKQNKRPTT